MKKTLIMLLALMQQPYTTGNYLQDTLGSMITAHSYKLAAATVVAAGAYGLNWLHHKRYVLDPQALPTPDNDATIITAFFHGAFDSSKQALQFIQQEGSNAPYLVAKDLVTMDFADSFSLSRLPFWTLKGCFGQDNDIAAMHMHLEQIKKDYPNLKSIIAGGISRGASAIINYNCVHGCDNIAARILESPYGSIEHVLAARAAKLGVPCAFVQALTPVLAWYYRAEGMHPIDMIKKQQTDTPTLIIAVETDHSVPVADTIALYKAMKEQGATRTHLLILQEGKHGALLRGPEGQRYQDVTHAFFKHYALPYNPEFAERGAAEFERMLHA